VKTNADSLGSLRDAFVCQTARQSFMSSVIGKSSLERTRSTRFETEAIKSRHGAVDQKAGDCLVDGT
jgi:hypothetical protein